MKKDKELDKLKRNIVKLLKNSSVTKHVWEEIVDDKIDILLDTESYNGKPRIIQINNKFF